MELTGTGGVYNIIVIVTARTRNGGTRNGGTKRWNEKRWNKDGKQCSG